jgi:hypothetical protein
MTYKAAREERGRKMNTTMRGRDLKAMAAMALLALVLLSAVAYAVWPTITTIDSGRDPAIYATSVGGSSITHDPYIDDHAEVIARYHEGSLR